MFSRKRLSLLAAGLSAAATTSAFVVPASRLVTQKVSNSRSSSCPGYGNGSRLCMDLSPPPTKSSRKRAAVDEDLKNEIRQEEVETFDPFDVENSDTGLSARAPSVEEQLGVTQDEGEKIGVWAARALLLGVAMLWGTNFAAVKYLENLCFHPPCNHPPSEAALARFGVAALVSLPVLLGKRLDVILAGMECGLWITFGYICQAMALETIGAGKCAFICSLTVVVVPLISALFFGKKIKPINVVTAAIALSGVGVLEGLIDFNALLGIQPAVADTATAIAPHAAVSASAETTGWLASAASTLGVSKGDIIALGQPLGFGFSFMRIEHYVEKFKDVENQVGIIAAAQCLAVGLMSLAWVLYDYHGTLPNFEYMLDPHRLVTIGWTGIMTTVVAIYLQGIALQTATATEAALTFSSEPVWASLFGAWLLREKLSTNSYIGGAIILVACVLGALADLPKPQPDDAIDVEGEVQ